MERSSHQYANGQHRLHISWSHQHVASYQGSVHGLDWTDTTSKLIGALRIAFLIPMELKLEFEQGIYLPIIQDDIPDDPTDPVFRYVVVACATEAGAMTCLPRRRSLLMDVDHCNKNYRYIASVIASFSAQLSSKCSCSFPRVFESIDLQTSPHPLTGLREFASMYSQYEC
eukprot:1266228-Rhodomonas_salina.1